MCHELPDDELERLVRLDAQLADIEERLDAMIDANDQALRVVNHDEDTDFQRATYLHEGYYATR
ncbi:hypothetical protein [Halorubellus litoreus]|uniref:Uncharacterized protein n=1 Tax=Halorubellus litoreus TaxID=755308 RepID=A0ABD5VE49_9EURY